MSPVTWHYFWQLLPWALLAVLGLKALRASLNLEHGRRPNLKAVVEEPGKPVPR